jgi:hypothetical protein
MTSLQLVRGPTDVVNPATGEQLSLLAETMQTLAQARSALSELKAQIDEANRLIDAEIARRLDLENTRQAVLDGLALKVNAPQKAVWDVGALRAALAALVNDGRLATGAANRALEPIVTYKTKEAELNKLLRHDDPEVRESIERCRRLEPQRRLVSVTPR